MKPAIEVAGSTTRVVHNAVGHDGRLSVHERKFKVGQSVSLTSGPGDDYQYQIKSANEPDERIVEESFAVEDFPAIRTLGVWMQVRDERFDSEEIHRLYESDDYPLRRRTG